MKKTVLITGGQGFVGRALVERFNALGYSTICADLNDQPLAGAAFAGVRFIKLDVRDKAAVIAACQGVDSVIHNASLVHTKHNRVADVWAVNLDGAKNILAACEAHAIPAWCMCLRPRWCTKAKTFVAATKACPIPN